MRSAKTNLQPGQASVTSWLWTARSRSTTTFEMNRLVRLLSVFLVATFALGSVAYAADATDMAMRMSAEVASASEAGDCGKCSNDADTSVSCDQSCVTSFVALPASEAVRARAMSASVGDVLPERLDGRARLPEPHPPKVTILD